MNETLKIILSLSVSGTLLILVLLLFKPLFKERLSKRWQYYIWLVVIARLLLPFAPETSLVGTLFQGFDARMEEINTAPPPEQDFAPASSADTPSNNIAANGQNITDNTGTTDPATVTAQSNILTIIWENLWLIWLVTALILLIRKITVYQSFVKYIKAGCIEVADIEQLEQFGAIIQRKGIAGTVDIGTNSLISTPLMIGFFHPCIVLPAADLSPLDFEYTILHELTHYKRGDVFYKWLMQLVVCLHWFNPFVYLMSHEISRTCELSCDEAVIRKLNTKGQRDYGDTLLNSIGAGGNYKDSLASITLSESKELLKERLDSIMGFKRKTRFTVTISIVLATVICFGGAAVGAYATPQAAIPKIHADINTPDKAGISYDKDYAKWDVTHIDDTYYYQNEPVRIFMDLREDNSFANFSYNENGRIDLRLVRNGSDAIIKAEYMSKSEANEILSDLKVEPAKEKEDISRLTLEEVPESVQSAINLCDNKTWYVIKGQGRQYIYYNNLPYNYAYQYDPAKNSIIIVDIGKSTGNYVLLSVPLNANLTISYNSMSVAYKNVMGETSVPQFSSTVNGMTLVEKEYTMAQLQSLNISGVIVNALSENVTIARGGKTLKVNYYTGKQKDYTLQKESDGGGTRQNLCLVRVTPLSANEAARNISITIPDAANFKVIKAVTDSGNVNLENCVASMFLGAKTQSGQILINGGSAEKFLVVNTNTGNARINGTSSPPKSHDSYSALLTTETGTFIFQPSDGAQNYHFIIDTEEQADVTVNGKQYSGGEYDINPISKQKVYFDSPNGTFIVQDLTAGKPALPPAAAQSKQTDSSSTSKVVGGNKLTLIRKEYTISELQKMGVTGVRVKALPENIVITKGGNALIFEYYQANAADYTVSTRDYEIYNEGYLTPEELAAVGGMSGMIKELELCRTGAVATDETARNIHITLPADSKYSRVIQVFSDSGSISLNGCDSTAMIGVSTKNGNIDAQNCTVPSLGVETQSGQIKLSGCKTDEFNIKTVSGAVTLRLPNRAADYKMMIDTNAKAQIFVNGKAYQGGELILNKNAHGKIYFDCNNGSFTVTEMKSR